MIELRGISVQGHGFSLKDVSLTVQTGSCHCLIGPTGCGKTTLLEAILGLRTIKEGRIFLDDRDITALPIHERGFSYVPQDLAIFPHLTVEENILYGITHGKVLNKEQRCKAAINLAESLAISHLLKRKPINLSGGERQRVALARALAPGNRYLLLDEPFSALHEGMKRELWFLLKRLQTEYGLTIFMVSHDMNETFFLADYITVMIDGKIHQTDEKKSIYRHPKNLQVARYFGIKNIFDAVITGVTDSHYRIYCKGIDAELMLPASKLKATTSIGMELTIGIRSEDVIVLRPDLPIKQDNLITGLITHTHFAGTTSIVRFQPQNTTKIIEIIMPEFAVAKLQLTHGSPATISLKSERLFVLEKGDHDGRP